jgi:competence protein ComGC
MTPLEILSLVLMAVGFAMVLSAKTIVKKYDLAKKQTCEHADQMSEEEVEDYKLNKAMLNFKLLGLAVTIPGLILFIIFFK